MLTCSFFILFIVYTFYITTIHYNGVLKYKILYFQVENQIFIVMDSNMDSVKNETVQVKQEIVSTDPENESW